MDRSTALELLHQYTETDSLRRHAYAVEAAMRAYAQKWNEDVEKWGITGLLHDFDYEKFPEEHPYKGEKILTEAGVDEDIREAIMGHATYTGVPRESRMAKALFAVDELCGFITAVTLVKPDKALSQVSAKSVKKKMKDKRFAAKVSREEMRQGAEELNLDFDSHAEFVVDALKPVAGDLGLNP